VGEDGEQPPLDVGYPPVRDGQEADRTGSCGAGGPDRGFQCLEVAARGAVEDIPPARAEPLANFVGGLEVMLAPALDALGQQLLSL
jgi:hypothetical protein